jgi:hypothetical protein
MANDILKGESATVSKELLNEISKKFKLAKVYNKIEFTNSAKLRDAVK